MEFDTLKRLIIIGVGIFSLVTTTVGSAYEFKETLSCILSKEIHRTDNSPDWAMGVFNGGFGIL